MHMAYAVCSVVALCLHESWNQSWLFTAHLLSLLSSFWQFTLGFSLFMLQFVSRVDSMQKTVPGAAKIQRLFVLKKKRSVAISLDHEALNFFGTNIYIYCIQPLPVCIVRLHRLRSYFIHIII